MGTPSKVEDFKNFSCFYQSVAYIAYYHTIGRRLAIPFGNCSPNFMNKYFRTKLLQYDLGLDPNVQAEVLVSNGNRLLRDLCPELSIVSVRTGFGCPRPILPETVRNCDILYSLLFYKAVGTKEGHYVAWDGAHEFDSLKGKSINRLKGSIQKCSLIGVTNGAFI